MKLIRFGSIGQEKPGIITGDSYFDLSSFVNDYDEAFFSGGGIEQVKTIIAANRHESFRIDAPVRLGSPIARPSKIVCIGLNYANHAKETGAPVPAEPIIFMNVSLAACKFIIPLQFTRTIFSLQE